MKITTLSLAAASVFTAALSVAHAGPVLIVSGQSGTSEPGTTTSVVANLQTLHQGVGNTVTVLDDIPTDLSAYKQVWDVRFSNSFALTSSQRTQYLGFLQSGGGMFLMGENSGFMSRNISIFNLIAEAGGGTVGPNLVGGCDGVQSVLAPFSGPNPVTTINFNCSGVVESSGTGNWIAQRADGSGGSGIAFAVGQLANAQDGALTTIFDVNFLQQGSSTPESNLARNLIGFIGDQVDPPSDVPEPATLALLGLGAAGLITRRRAKQHA